VIASEAAQVFRQQAFKSLSPQTIERILTNTALQIKEEELFDAVLAWAKLQVKKRYHSRSELVSSDSKHNLNASTDEEEHKQDDLRDVLEPLLPLIRFPLMSMQYFSTVVIGCHVLSPAEQLEAFTVIALNQKSEEQVDVEIPECKFFNSQPRDKGARKFKWDRFKNHQLQISQDGMSAKGKRDGVFGTVSATAEGFLQGGIGRLHFELELAQVSDNDNALGLNVIFASIGQVGPISSGTDIDPVPGLAAPGIIIQTGTNSIRDYESGKSASWDIDEYKVGDVLRVSYVRDAKQFCASVFLNNKLLATLEHSPKPSAMKLVAAALQLRDGAMVHLRCKT
jgi:BTB And C-terminal Kelch